MKEDNSEESSSKYLGQDTQDAVSLKNGISYRPNDENCCPLRLFVSRIEFNRRIEQIARGNKMTRTMTFPNTVRRVRDEAFYFSRQLLSVILNEGLETIGIYEGEYRSSCCGVFTCSRLEHVAFPETLRVLGDGTFRDCKKLERISFAERASSN